jgi:hypothetical protein
MLVFKTNLKLYLFKSKNQVSLSIKVSDNCVNAFNFTIEEFEKILESWTTPNGFEIQTKNSFWAFRHKTSTPRPECAKTSYVSITVHLDNSMTCHYRVSYDDMYNLKKDYFYQKHNSMYWDKDV